MARQHCDKVTTFIQDSIKKIYLHSSNEANKEFLNKLKTQIDAAFSSSIADFEQNLVTINEEQLNTVEELNKWRASELVKQALLQYKDPECKISKVEKKTPKSKKMKAIVNKSREKSTLPATSIKNQEKNGTAAGFRKKIRVVVGNISQLLLPESRGADGCTHKWMVYIHGGRDCPQLDRFVRSIDLFLDPSYKPDHIVTLTKAPFNLTRRGWGEFPIRILLHFHDQRNKPFEIIHQLKLTTKQLDYQICSGETAVDISLIMSEALSLPITFKKPNQQENAKMFNGFKATKHELENVPDLDSLPLFENEDPIKGPATSKSSKLLRQEDNFSLDSGISSTFSTPVPSPGVNEGADIWGASDDNLKSPTRLSSPTISIKQEKGSEESSFKLSKNSIKFTQSIVPKPIDIKVIPSAMVGSSSSLANFTIPSIKQEMSTPPSSPAPSPKSVRNSPLIKQDTSPILSPLQKTSPLKVTFNSKIPFSSTIKQEHNFNVLYNSSASTGKTLTSFTLVKPLNQEMPFGQNSIASTSTSILTPSSNIVKLAPHSPSKVPATLPGSGMQSFLKPAVTTPQLNTGTLFLASLPANTENAAKVQAVPGNKPPGLIPFSSLPANVQKQILSRLGNARPEVAQARSAPLVSISSTNVLRPSNILTIAKTRADVSTTTSTLTQIRPSPINTVPHTIQQNSQVKAHLVNAVRPTHQNIIIQPSRQGILNSSFVNIAQSQQNVALQTLVKSPAITQAVNQQVIVPNFVLSNSISSKNIQSISPAMKVIRLPTAMSQVAPIPEHKRVVSQVVLNSSKPTLLPYPLKVKNEVPLPSCKTGAPIALPQVLVNSIPPPSKVDPPKGVVNVTRTSFNKTILKPTPHHLSSTKRAPTLEQDLLKVIMPKRTLSKNLHDLRSGVYPEMSSLVARLAELFPLYGKNMDTFIHPYCAQSFEDFLGWKLWRKRAAEWQRARQIKEALAFCSHSNKVWSTKHIVLWCRRNGFTPFYKDSCTSSKTASKNTSGHVSSLDDVQPVLHLIERRFEDHKECKPNDEEEEVDILTVSDEESEASGNPSISPHKRKLGHEDALFLPATSPSGALEFIHDACSEMGLQLNSEEIEPGIFAPTPEEILIQCCKRFASDLLRAAFSKTYARSYNKGSESIDVVTKEDVYWGIMDSPPMADLLSNRYLGTPLDLPGSNKPL